MFSLIKGGLHLSIFGTDPVKVNKNQSINLIISNSVQAEINPANGSDNLQLPKINLNNEEPLKRKRSRQQTNA